MVSKYIGSAREKQDQLEGLQDILEVLKMLREQYNLSPQPALKNAIESLYNGYKDSKRRIHNH